MADIYGIDVSHYQGKIDWPKVAGSGKKFVIMKAMIETNKRIESTFEYNYEQSGLAGLQRGVYNYIGSISAADPKADAEALLKILGGRKLELGVWLDVESSKVRARGRAVVEQVILTEADVISRAGYQVGIYCNADWFKNVITQNIKQQFEGRFWIARYSGKDDGSVPASLSPKEQYPQSIGWQYSSKGKVPGINGNVDLDVFWGAVKEQGEPKHTRAAVVNLVNSWVGKNEADGSFKEIIDIYNSYPKRGYTMKYTDAWCACMWSALAVKLGYTDIMPVEVSCSRIIEKAKAMGIWREADAYIPGLADAILYDWQDTGAGDNTGNPDHIGVVTYVNQSAGNFVVAEGNYSNAVKKRTVQIDGKYIRGFITPKYEAEGVISSQGQGGSSDVSKRSVDTVAREVIAGQWGNGADRKSKLEVAGYSYSQVQAKVNEILNGSAKASGVQKQTQNATVTASSKAKRFNEDEAGTFTVTASSGLYLRDGAGTNKKALCLMPNGTSVRCYGYYTDVSGVRWKYVATTIAGKKYEGFCSSRYLK